MMMKMLIIITIVKICTMSPQTINGGPLDGATAQPDFPCIYEITRVYFKGPDYISQIKDDNYVWSKL